MGSSSRLTSPAMVQPGGGSIATDPRAPCGLVDAQYEAVAILGGLERAERNRLAGEAEERARAVGRGPERRVEKWPVQVLGFGEHAARDPVTRMREQRVGQALLALVGQAVGQDG